MHTPLNHWLSDDNGMVLDNLDWVLDWVADISSQVVEVLHQTNKAIPSWNRIRHIRISTTMLLDSVKLTVNPLQAFPLAKGHHEELSYPS